MKNMQGEGHEKQGPWFERRSLPNLASHRAGDTGKHIVRIAADEPDGSNNNNENDSQHYRVFCDILAFIFRPQRTKTFTHEFFPPPFSQDYSRV
jgi:hypothetical protein